MRAYKRVSDNQKQQLSEHLQAKACNKENVENEPVTSVKPSLPSVVQPVMQPQSPSVQQPIIPQHPALSQHSVLSQHPVLTIQGGYQLLKLPVCDLEFVC